MNRKIIVTEDNSKTLLIPSLNETYHSTKGALTESIHVFIKEGLSKINSTSTIQILEMGFGTGLNLLVTLDYVRNKNIGIDYSTIEKHPLDNSLIQALDYSKLYQNKTIIDHYLYAHQAEWGIKIQLNDEFSFTKLHQDVQFVNLQDESYDLIYYDAFGPKIQPDLWKPTLLSKMYRCLRPQGMLVTYCAQGQFKRNLKEVSFHVESLPGPPGKREMVRATKK